MKRKYLYQQKLIDMNSLLVIADYNVQGFSASRIIFDDSDLVSMDVSCRIGGKLIRTTFMFTFSKFNDLLRFSGESGEKLQLKVSDKLVSDEAMPYIIDLQHEPLVFTTCRLDLTYLLAGDDSCFSVEEVMPLSLVQQARNLRMNIADFRHVQLQQDSPLNAALIEVATLYRYYMGLKELNLSDEHAREKAGLKNEKLFRIAFHAAKSAKVH